MHWILHRDKTARLLAGISRPSILWNFALRGVSLLARNLPCDLTGHPKATRAYAWSSPIEGSDKRRFFAVLHIPPVTSPMEAVRAAIVTEHRERKLDQPL